MTDRIIDGRPHRQDPETGEWVVLLNCSYSRNVFIGNTLVAAPTLAERYADLTRRLDAALAGRESRG